MIADCQPVEVVQAQVEAYNRGDLEAFVGFYAPTIEIFDHPGKLQMRGVDQMRETYAPLFTRMPELRVDIRNRIAIGDTVIDHEAVIPAPGSTPAVEVAAIYQVRGCKITRVDFTPVPEGARQ